MPDKVSKALGGLLLSLYIYLAVKSCSVVVHLLEKER